jgi:nitrogenase iron protein NifH
VTVTQAELAGKTTIEAAPQSAQAAVYRQLADKVYTLTEGTVPAPLDELQLREWAAQWSTQILALAAAEEKNAFVI